MDRRHPLPQRLDRHLGPPIIKRAIADGPDDIASAFCHLLAGLGDHSTSYLALNLNGESSSSSRSSTSCCPLLQNKKEGEGWEVGTIDLIHADDDILLRQEVEVTLHCVMSIQEAVPLEPNKHLSFLFGSSVGYRHSAVIACSVLTYAGAYRYILIRLWHF
jgi:hypothetical protein